MKVEIEGVLSCCLSQDRGMAKIGFLDEARGADEGFFVQLHSWSEERLHETFDALAGKKLRITIETLPGE